MLVRKAAFFSWKQLMQILIISQNAENNDFYCPVLKGISLSKLSPNQGSGYITVEEIKNVKAEGYGVL